MRGFFWQYGAGGSGDQIGYRENKMGQEKEERLVREEQTRLHAKKCDLCGQPLLVASERSTGVCSSCQKPSS
jgi:hypothetical protein